MVESFFTGCMLFQGNKQQKLLGAFAWLNVLHIILCVLMIISRH